MSAVVRLPLMRLVRSQPTWLTVAGWSAFALASASLQRFRATAHGADRALDVYAAITVPLLVYGLVAAACGYEGLARSGRALVLLGAPKGAVARATVLVTMAASALACGALGAVVCAWAHGPGDPPRMQDALVTLGCGALAGAAYASFFALGAAVVGSWGRTVMLMLDWGLGSSEGVGALFTPRAHLRNMLGGEGPVDLVAWESMAAMAAMAIVCASLAVRQAARARV
jgi:hypothetical protein